MKDAIRLLLTLYLRGVTVNEYERGHYAATT